MTMTMTMTMMMMMMMMMMNGESVKEEWSGHAAVVPGRHVHPSVGDIRPHSSAFCRSLRPRRSADSLSPSWASRFHRLGSSDLEQSVTWSPRHVSVSCEFPKPTQDWTIRQGILHDIIALSWLSSSSSSSWNNLYCACYSVVTNIGALHCQ